MASPAAASARLSLLAAGARVCAAPRRAAAPVRVRLPPTARPAPPRSLSLSIVLRPRVAQGGASGRSESAQHERDDFDLGLGPTAEEEPHEGAAMTELGDDAGVGMVLCAPTVEEPHEVAATTDLGDDAGVSMVLYGPTVQEPREGAATTELGDDAGVGMVLYGPTVQEPRGTTDLGDDAGFGMVPCAPTVEEPREGAATTDDEFVVDPIIGLSKRDLREFEATDFSRAAIDERFRRESKEAIAVVTDAVAGVFFRPLRELLNDVRSFGSVFDAQEFHIGMPFGLIMTCLGLYQVCKLNPSTCIDVALAYAFYRLSVIAADVRRRGFSPDWIIRIRFGIIIAMLAKELGKKTVDPLDYIRLAIFLIYGISVNFDVKGLKKYARCFLPLLFLELCGLRLVEEEEEEEEAP